jgi:DnaD/phage-associated family protein
MNHGFNVDIAMICGVHGAIIFDHLWFWVQKNKADGRNQIEGRYWTFASCRELQEKFPYMTTRQIQYALKKLIDCGLILTGCFNAKGYDRTTWYTVSDKGAAISNGQDSHLTKLSNGTDKIVKSISQNCEMEQTKLSNGTDKIVKSISQNCEMEQTKLSNGTDKIVEPIPDNYTDNYSDNDTDKNASAGGTARACDNPFSADYAPRAPDPLVAYAARTLTRMSPNNVEELLSYRDELPDELIIHAIDETTASGSTAYRYTKAILNRYVDQGIKTVAEAEAKKKGGNTNAVDSRPTEEDLFAGFAPEEIAEIERLANDGEQYG